MKKFKQLGIWMDDANALLMEFYNHMIISKSIVFKPLLNEENNPEQQHDTQMQSKEENKYQLAFFKEISDIVLNYQEVLLFGPTQAKNELLELIKADHNFANIKFDVIDTEVMTENKMHEFVIEYFR